MFHFCLYSPLRLYVDRFWLRLVLSLCPLALGLIAHDSPNTLATVETMILWTWPVMLVSSWFLPLPSTHVAPPSTAKQRR